MKKKIKVAVGNASWGDIKGGGEGRGEEVQEMKKKVGAEGGKREEKLWEEEKGKEGMEGEVEETKKKYEDFFFLQ